MSQPPAPDAPPALAAAVTRRLVERDFVVDDLDAAGLTVHQAGRGESARLDLANLRRLLAQVGQDRFDEVVDSWVDAAVAGYEGHGDGPPELARLLPRLGRPESDGHDVSFYAPLAGDALRVLLVDDQPGLVRYQRTLDLIGWQLSAVRAQARALENLVARSEGVEAAPLPGLDGAFDIVVGDTYDAARLLVLDHWVPGPLGSLAVVPARDLLWFVPVVGPESVSLGVHLWQEAHACLDEVPYKLVGDLFWQAQGRLERVEVREEDGQIRVRLPARLQSLLDDLATH